MYDPATNHTSLIGAELRSFHQTELNFYCLIHLSGINDNSLDYLDEELLDSDEVLESEQFLRSMLYPPPCTQAKYFSSQKFSEI